MEVGERLQLKVLKEAVNSCLNGTVLHTVP